MHQEAFPEAMQRLANVSSSESSDRLMTDKTMRNASCFQPLRRFNPFKLNGIMKMDGRLLNACLPPDSKHLLYWGEGI